MIVMINGAFGAGKTTVAKLLRRSLPGSAIYNPECAGIILQRLERFIRFEGSGTDDFQDIGLWRRSAVWGVELFRSFTSGSVIVPMTFTRREYLEEVVAGLRRAETSPRVFCLQASLPTIERRLVARGEKAGPDLDWMRRRNIECAQAHRDPGLGEPIDTENRSARDVAAEILQRIRKH